MLRRRLVVLVPLAAFLALLLAAMRNEILRRRVQTLTLLAAAGARGG